MRRFVLALPAALVLGGPVALAFRSGAFFDGPRLVALVVASALVAATALAAPVPLPRERAGRLALAGLALLAVWTTASIAWAPLADPAVDAVQLALLYTAALIAAAAWLRGPSAPGRTEAAVAAGAFVVVGYGLGGRLLPDLFDLATSARAGGRLEQPLTYWNAQGALAGIGVVLCARVAGDPGRSARGRVLAAAAGVPLGLGVYLTYSRGALAATVGGLLVLLALAPTRAQARAVAAIAIATALAAFAASLIPGIGSLEGTLAERRADGLVGLAVLAVLCTASALAVRSATAGRAAPRAGAALGVVALVVAGLVAGGLAERDRPAFGADASRLASVGSNRRDYWDVALRAAADAPLVGTGAGGFEVEWLRERPIAESTRAVHSLELGTLSELGLVGLAALALFLVGAALACRRGLAVAPEATAGLVAAFAVWAMHSTIDWDWEMPAVTLPAITLLGAVAARSEHARPTLDP